MGIIEILMSEMYDKRLKDCCEDVINYDKASDKINDNIKNLSINELTVVLGTAQALQTSIIRRLFQEAKKKESKED